MLGQEWLLNHFKNVHQLPNTMILVGPKGHGKRTLAKYITENILNCILYDVPDLKVDNVREVIKDSTTLHEPKMYLFSNADSMTVQAQNALLKLAEEPPEHCYIVLTVESKESLLNTILSRSSVSTLKGYSPSILEEYCKEKGYNLEYVNYVQNIGEIEELESYVGSENLITLVKRVVSNIGKASLSNVFKIPLKIEKEYVHLFIRLLEIECSNKLREMEKNNDPEIYKFIKLIKVLYHYKRLFNNRSINKQNLLDMMVVEMWEVFRFED